jgi:hypothetical protein
VIADLRARGLPRSRLFIDSREQGLRWSFVDADIFLIAAIIAPIALLPNGASAQAPARIPAEPQLTLSQVVEKLVQKNAERAKALESYRGRRIYELDYRGFPTALRAEMTVDMTYNAPARKEFKILSESGTKWIVKRVLKRLIETEREAQAAANRASVELNTSYLPSDTCRAETYRRQRNSC